LPWPSGALAAGCDFGAALALGVVVFAFAPTFFAADFFAPAFFAAGFLDAFVLAFAFAFVFFAAIGLPYHISGRRRVRRCGGRANGDPRGSISLDTSRATMLPTPAA